uniref:Tc1-like transposase DDE domain-containing protein n=1 Tax=Anopheles stephensi TaxID=30069 RepID=A0A182YQU6_ANOST
MSPMHKKVILTKAKELLRFAESGEWPNLVFSNEKPFVIQQFMNEQNDRVYLLASQKPAMVMVWASLTVDGRSPLVFIDSEIKKRKSIDSAPSHLARASQEWLRNEVPRFISTAQWPPKSPDANPLDYCAWYIMESKVSTKKYQSVDQLKQALRREWVNILQSH